VNATTVLYMLSN